MPEYRITTPDGATYNVTAPDGASQDEVLARVQAQHGGETTPKVEAKPEPVPTITSPESAGSFVARGMTAGLSDYVSAGIDEGVDWAVSKARGQTLTKGYNDYLKSVRGGVDQYREDNPWKANAAEILGGIISPLFGGEAMLVGRGLQALGMAGKTVIPRFAGYGAHGLAAGALGGAGNARGADQGLPTASDVGASAGEGALLGGALGVAVPAVAEGGLWAAGKARDATQGVLDQMPGAQASAAGRRLAKAANLEGMSPDQVRAAVNQMGPDATIADTGKYFRSLAESAANQSPEAMGVAEGLGARQEGQAERIQAAALQAAGVPSKDAAIANRSRVAGPMYEQAFAPPPDAPLTTKSPQVTSPFIENMLEQPESQKGLQEGMDSLRRDSVITGQKLDPNDYALQRNADTGQWEKVGTPNLRTLDAVSRGYRIMLEGDGPDMVHPTTGTPTNKARQISIMKDMFDKEIESQLPKVPGTATPDNPQGVSAWGLARQTWANMSKPIEALNTIDKVVDKAYDASDLYNRLYGSPANRAKLQGLTQDPAKMAQFDQALKTEKTFAQTKGQVLGSARTGYRNAMAANDQTDIGGAAVHLATGNFSGLFGSAIRKLGSMLTAPPEAVAAQLAPLTSTNRAQQDMLLNLMRSRAQAMRLNLPQLGPALGRSGGAFVGPMLGGSNQ